MNDTPHILVDPNRPLPCGLGRPLGINVNAFTDGELAEARFDDLAAALRAMGVRMLRYPGGDKSDGLWWSPPPHDRPALALVAPDGGPWPADDRRVFADGRFVRPPLEFDRFIELCRAVEAEPLLVVPYDCLHPLDPATPRPSRDELIRAAAAWVRYANVERGYRVRLWELGNESYLWNHNGAASAEAYARDFPLFAAAMKQVDPGLLLLANGPNGWRDLGERDRRAELNHPWWPELHAATPAGVDAVSLHHYPGWQWNAFAAYAAQHHELDLVARAAADITARLAEGRQAPPRAFVTEYNVADWSQGGWPHRNDLGHAVALAEGLGRLVTSDAVDAALVWNTRWMAGDDAAEVWDAFDSALRLRPTGEAMAAWRRTRIGRFVHVAPPPDVAAFACADDAGRVALLLVNRLDRAVPIRLDVAGRDAAVLEASALTGAGPDDIHPAWRDLAFAGPAATLPGVSLTTILLAPAQPPSP